MKANAKAAFDLIKHCLYDQNTDVSYLSDLTDDDIKALFVFSKAHDVAHIVGLALKNNGLLLSGGYSDKFLSEINVATYRYLQLNAAFNEISDVFRQEKIPFIPLKGTVLRKFYPQPYLRTSSDIDIYINKDDIARAESVLVNKCRYKVVVIGDEHDVSFISPSGVHLELHYRLIEKMPKAEKMLENIWEKASKDEENEYLYHLSGEYFFLYHMVHMARHFIYGGIGIKPVLDLYFIKNKMEFDILAADELLKQAELLTFTREVEALFDVWFNAKEPNDILKEMHKYLLLSGTFGRLENATVTAQIKNGGRFKYLLRRIFMPYSELKTFYPILVRHPLLTPFYQIKRWLRLLLFSKKRIKTEIKYNVNVTREQTSSFQNMLDQLDLKISK